jgi:hypothetical protein
LLTEISKNFQYFPFLPSFPDLFSPALLLLFIPSGDFDFEFLLKVNKSFGKIELIFFFPNILGMIFLSFFILFESFPSVFII